MAVKILTDANWYDTILGDKPAVVHFKADWCGPCRMTGPLLERLSNENGDSIIFGSVDVDENPETPEKYSIRTIPTTLFFKDGEMVGQILGAFSKSQVESKIEEYLVW